MNKKIKAKDYKYCVFGDRHSAGIFFWMRIGCFADWFSIQPVLRFAKLVDAKKFMTFAKLFDCTYG